MHDNDNPMGLDGFAFLEFTTPDFPRLKQQFEALGFTQVAKHMSRAIYVFAQGHIRFIVNQQPASLAEHFAHVHGASCCGMGFRVKDAKMAFEMAVDLGATPFTSTVNPGELRFPAIFGIGGSVIYFVDDAHAAEFYHNTMGLPEDFVAPHGTGLIHLDHLTHNLKQGHMDIWFDYYHRLFNFRQIRFFEIKGAQTGLVSRALASPDGKIKIPLNESTDPYSQIEEFIRDFHGEGIQHMALTTENIYETVAMLRERGIQFMEVPDTYYAYIDNRLPGHGENIDALRNGAILIDGETTSPPPKLLLQIFTMPMLGPVFFEIIQRKGDEGFGEGNFKALFEAIERDQIKRGVLPQTKSS